MVGIVALMLGLLATEKPVAARPSLKSCKTQEGMGIMGEDSVVFCARVYGRNKIQAQIDVLQRVVNAFDQRRDSYLFLARFEPGSDDPSPQAVRAPFDQH